MNILPLHGFGTSAKSTNNEATTSTNVIPSRPPNPAWFIYADSNQMIYETNTQGSNQVTNVTEEMTNQWLSHELDMEIERHQKKSSKTQVGVIYADLNQMIYETNTQGSNQVTNVTEEMTNQWLSHELDMEIERNLVRLRLESEGKICDLKQELHVNAVQQWEEMNQMARTVVSLELKLSQANRQLAQAIDQHAQANDQQTQTNE